MNSAPVASCNILDPAFSLDRHLLIEASAGTGKTFTIENIVVRLLLEGDTPLTIDQILVVTFTRMATGDLKKRIRSQLERALSFVSGRKNLETENRPEYLHAYCVDPVLKKVAKGRLERALLAFEEADINTIHSFCSKMLREYALKESLNENFAEMESAISPSMLMQTIRDYLRSQILPEHIGMAQLKHLIQKGSTEGLEQELLYWLEKGGRIEEPPSFSSLLKSFQTVLYDLKNRFGLNQEQILADFEQLVPCYKELCDRKGKIKEEIKQKITRFAALFDKSEWNEEDFNQLIVDQLIWCQIFTEKQLKVRAKFPEHLYFPEITKQLKESLNPLVNLQTGLARMVYECVYFFRRLQERENKWGYDGLLKKMVQSLEDNSFENQVRKRYRAVIVDEFQDTDPVQWKIFKTAFPPSRNDWGKLYIVGDPKQSIYAFRQADIYTYLDAAELVGKEGLVVLDTNYRSQSSLVEALNALFTPSTTPDWMPLPRLEGFLPVPAVKSSFKIEEKHFHDNRGAFHFFIADDKSGKTLQKVEESAYFPFIVQEIQRLHFLEKVPLSAFAILVADRFQAERMASYLREWKISTILQRKRNLGDTDALQALRELLKGILQYNNESFLKTALGGKILGWTHAEIRLLDKNEILEKVLSACKNLVLMWNQEGGAFFFHQLLNIPFFGGVSPAERILVEVGGGDFLDALQQLIESLLEIPGHHKLTLERALIHLDEMERLSQERDEKTLRRQDSENDAVQILTIHASKGLEYEIVFALGLVKRKKQTPLFIPDVKGDQTHFRFFPNENALERHRYLEEIDAEKMRQLYVALTRAKHRVYCPVLLSQERLEMGSASPIDLFLSYFRRAESGEDLSHFGIYQRIETFDGQKLFEFLDENQGKLSIGKTLLQETPFFLNKEQLFSEIKLISPKKIVLSGSPQYIHSFSSLSLKPGDSEHYLSAPHDFFILNKTSLNLPSGSETGTLLHTIFENIPFSSAQKWQNIYDTRPFISPFVRETRFALWEETIASLVYNTLKTPLIDNWALQDLSQDELMQEGEFLFKSVLPSAPGYIKGFIDLMFCHEGKYYLLDWKTNWLGSEVEDYRKEKLEEAMDHHEYFLQAEFYTHALKKYLALFDEREFKTLFGGVFYLFIRGMPEHGVYHFFPKDLIQ